MSTFLWIVFVCSIALSVSQPVISPGGTIDVFRGENLTLTCSYEEKPSDRGTVCKWSEIPRGVEYPISRMYLLYNQSICIKTFPDGNHYGYGCHGNNAFLMTIFNAQEGNNGTRWICEQMVGKDNMALSEHVTLNVIDHPTHQAIQSVTGSATDISSGSSVSDSSADSPKEIFSSNDFVISTSIPCITTILLSNTSSAISNEHIVFESGEPVSQGSETYIIIVITAGSIVFIMIGVGATYHVVHMKKSRRSRGHLESEINIVEGQNQPRSAFVVTPTYEQLQLSSR
ncbi:uncharacterized protein LOC127831779 isoform X3 [Dreissena polymorpha]|uniref:uncharacterized protein LOC127831779 isoform X3 n=1 Tax=Dreissena polymorpha TaxID=45954 RepID=UPI002265256C|nr:uncharacterized protein LOC127831779 isoform X3 [Dreissena polymorpha]